MSKFVSVIVVVVLLAGCDSEFERQARVEAERREALQLAQREQSRREFWQGVSCITSVVAVVLLIVGVGIGSRSKPHGPNPTA